MPTTKPSYNVHWWGCNQPFVRTSTNAQGKSNQLTNQKHLPQLFIRLATNDELRERAPNNVIAFGYDTPTHAQQMQWRNAKYNTIAIQKPKHRSVRWQRRSSTVILSSVNRLKSYAGTAGITGSSNKIFNDKSVNTLSRISIIVSTTKRTRDPNELHSDNILYGFLHARKKSWKGPE